MDSMWIQFRRLLLGTVVEILLEEGVQLEFPSLRIAFDGDSEFRVPRLDNYMRFKGELTAHLTTIPAGLDQGRLQRALEGAWPELLKVVDIPIGDRLTPDRNHIKASIEGSTLHVRFDLVAD